MTFDGITTRAVVLELQEKLSGGVLRKINQIAPHTLTLSFYANQENHLLYLTADPAKACLFLTNRKFQNPITPPDFCMVLRKHLAQARLTDIRQEGMDRTVSFCFSGRNELGDDTTLRLVGEFMGKYSNLILVGPQERVIDAIRHVSHDMSRVRQIYPGAAYHFFPSEKKDLLDQKIVLKDLAERTAPQAQANKLFVKNLTGFSPLAARELLFRAGLDPDQPLASLRAEDWDLLQGVFDSFAEAIRKGAFQPGLYGTNKITYYPLPLYHLGPARAGGASLSALMDRYYTEHGRDDRMGQQKAQLFAQLKAAQDRLEKKLAHQRADFQETLDREDLKEEGDLLAAQVHTLRKGMDQIRLADFFHDNEPRTIALDPGKAPWENVKERYRRYSKLKRAHQLLSESLPALEELLAYYQQLGSTIEQAQSEEDLAAIRTEMVREGLIKEKGRKKTKKSAPKALPPYRYQSPNGFDLYVGRNNRQNDQLTLKTANKEDLFFHAQGIAGAHVILRTGGKTPDSADIEAACWLAAKNSAQGAESSVMVDYTERKNVYKAKGAKPGMVYYHDFSSLLVNPKKNLPLKRKEEV